MKTVLITGASGFIGTNLCRYFGHCRTEIICVKYRKGIEYDIPSGINAVIHLAGKAHDLKNSSSWEDYYQANYENTRKIFDAFLKSDAEKFIFTSSVKAVTEHADLPLSEDEIPHPETMYGRSKRMAEEYLQSCALPEGKRVYILRPCMVHGPGNKGNLNLLYHFIAKGLPYPLASFKNKRSFLSIQNLCYIINELVKKDNIPGGIYNVADNEPLPTTEVAMILSEALRKHLRLWYLPEHLITQLATIGSKLKLPFNSERLAKLTDNYIVSNQKIIQAIKKDLPLSARSGILETARAFKESALNGKKEKSADLAYTEGLQV